VEVELLVAGQVEAGQVGRPLEEGLEDVRDAVVAEFCLKKNS